VYPYRNSQENTDAGRKIYLDCNGRIKHDIIAVIAIYIISSIEHDFSSVKKQIYIKTIEGSLEE
jgi:hypothetical protein